MGVGALAYPRIAGADPDERCVATQRSDPVWQSGSASLPDNGTDVNHTRGCGQGIGYRVARQPRGCPALSEPGVKVSLHPAQALRTPL
jgi:hypothetical protein